MTGTPLSPSHEDAVIAELNAKTQKTLAEAARETSLAAIAALNREERERVQKYGLVHDNIVHHYVLTGGIKQETVSPLVHTLKIWHRLNPACNIDIEINTPGGLADDGMYLFDTLTAFSLRGGGTHKITMTVRGRAASMGAILLQAADDRVIGAQSSLLVHQISAGTSGKPGDMKDDIKWYEKLCDNVAKIFVERSNGGITLRTFKQRWEGRDWWLDADESLKLGFVDRIG